MPITPTQNEQFPQYLCPSQSRQSRKREKKSLYGNYSKLVESSPFLFNFMFIIVFCVCLLFTDMQNNFFIG